MRYRTILSSLLLGASASALSCAAKQRPVIYVTPRDLPESHVLFNPESTGVPLVDVPRDTWLETVVYSNPHESIEYREVIRDRSGWLWGQNDYYNRRFESKRSGFSRR